MRISPLNVSGHSRIRRSLNNGPETFRFQKVQYSHKTKYRTIYFEAAVSQRAIKALSRRKPFYHIMCGDTRVEMNSYGICVRYETLSHREENEE